MCAYAGPRMVTAMHLESQKKEGWHDDNVVHDSNQRQDIGNDIDWRRPVQQTGNQQCPCPSISLCRTNHQGGFHSVIRRFAGWRSYCGGPIAPRSPHYLRQAPFLSRSITSAGGSCLVVRSRETVSINRSRNRLQRPHPFACDWAYHRSRKLADPSAVFCRNVSI